MSLSISFDLTPDSIKTAVSTLKTLSYLHSNNNFPEQMFDDNGIPINADSDADDIPDTTLSLDDEKLPHDTRIHSVNKTICKTGDRKGCWKYKKNVTPELIAQVESELQLALDTPPAPPSSNTPPAPPSSNTPPAPPTEIRYVIGDTSYTRKELKDAKYKDSAIDALPVETADANVITWPVMMIDVATAIADGRLTQADVDKACSKHNVKSYPLLSARPDLIPLIHAELF